VEKRNSVIVLPEVKPIDFKYLLLNYDSICLIGEVTNDINLKIDEAYEVREKKNVSKSVLRLSSAMCCDANTILGCKTEELLWKDGILTNFVKSSESTDKLVIMENPSITLFQFLCRALDSQCLNLADGQRYRLKN
jgi:hypothetical protein